MCRTTDFDPQSEGMFMSSITSLKYNEKHHRVIVTSGYPPRRDFTLFSPAIRPIDPNYPHPLWNLGACEYQAASEAAIRTYLFLQWPPAPYPVTSQ